MGKPSDVKVRQCYQHLTRVNNEEITGLPPAFDATEKLSDEEMTDIILFGAPRTWQNEMDRQGFDPMEKTPGEVIAFMENIEATEDRPDANKKSNATSEKEAKKPKKSGNSNGGKTKHHCAEHGENLTPRIAAPFRTSSIFSVAKSDC